LIMINFRVTALCTKAALLNP